MSERANGEMKRRWSWKIKLYNLFSYSGWIHSLSAGDGAATAAASHRHQLNCVEFSTSDIIIITTNNLHSNFRCPFPHSYRLTAFLSFANNKQKIYQWKQPWKATIAAANTCACPCENERKNITRKLHLQFPVDISFSRRFDWVILVLEIKILSARLT